MRRLAVLALPLFVAACTINPKPKPPAPPPPTPGCEDGQVTCCWHQPPGNDWLYACPAPGVSGGVLNVAGGPAQCPEKRCGDGTAPPTLPPDPSSPVPPKGVPQGAEKLLRVKSDLRGLVTNESKPFVPFGVEACCDSWARCPDEQGSPAGTGWPGLSACFVTETAKYGANLWHFRVGPWFSKCANWDDPGCGEPYWASVGGAYAADGSWNAAFWAKLRELVWQAYQKGGYVEVVPVDDWWLKNACGKEESCGKKVPWSGAAVDAWGKTWHPEHAALYRKTVEEVGCFGNVIWATGNEEDLIPGATSSHLQARVDALREYERAVGCNFVHIIGTGSFQAGITADYQITHENAPVGGPCNGRYCANNEHNPEVSPEEEAARFDQATKAGQRYDAWRAGAKDEAWEKRLGLFKGVLEGSVATGCFAPPPEPESMWGTPVTGSGQMRTAVEQAKTAVGSKCGRVGEDGTIHSGALDTLADLAAELRRAGHCASGPWVDALAVVAPDGKVEEYHAVAFSDGCYSNNPAVMPKYRHTYLGQTGGGGGTAGCTAPVPPKVHTFNPPKKQNAWYDSTPIVSGHDYCVAIGMGTMPDGVQPRNECPVRNECPGVKCEERAACERVAMGGLATWRSDGQTEVNAANENHLQARCTNCTYLEVCNADLSVCRRTATR